MERPLHGNEPLRALSFTTRYYNKTVCISDGTDAGGLAGAKGAYQLAQIDTALVEGELLKLIAAIVQHELTCIWPKEVGAMGKNTNRNLRNRRRKQLSPLCQICASGHAGSDGSAPVSVVVKESGKRCERL
jgi:hypothetical protein